jgi:hypothetical protein
MTRFSRGAIAALTLLISLLASLVHGATFIVPEDEELIRGANAILTGRVLFAQPYFTDQGEIATQVQLIVDRSLKGPFPPGSSVTIHVPGGVIGDQGMKVSFAPAYWANATVLVFLERRDGDYWITHGQVLGKFELVNYFGEEIYVRGLPEEEIYGWDHRGNRHHEVPRRVDRFLRYIQEVVAGENASADYFLDSSSRTRPAIGGDSAKTAQQFTIEPTAHGYPPSAYLMASGGTAFRWNRFDQGSSATFRVSGSQPGYDSIGVAQRALAAWTNDPNSNINLQYAGTSSAGFVKNGENTIVYNSSTDVPGSAIGYSQIYSSGSHTFGGQTFWTIVEGDVVMRAGLSISAAAFEEAVTHEVGHALGFRHSNEGTPADSNAVMNSVVSGRFGSALQAWDREAASHVYGTGTTSPTPSPSPTPTPCVAPSITAQPTSRTISAGQSTTLSVTASGTTPLSYQWYFGSSGNTSSPVPGGGGPSLTVAPPSTTSYWVRVSNACGSVNSATATVTVTTTSTTPPPPSLCSAPSITIQPASQSITAGQTAFLSVSVTGTAPFTYQWFEGLRGDTSRPFAGGTGATLPVSPPVTTSYWVRVSNGCGTADSLSATVTVNTPAARAGFYLLPPCRLIDTRSANGGPAVPGGAARTVFLANRCGIPADAKAVSTNLTVVPLGTAAGYLALYPADVPPPPVSTVNFGRGRVRANNAVVRVSGDGSVSIGVFNGGPEAAHFIIDVNGYFR